MSLKNGTIIWQSNVSSFRYLLAPVTCRHIPKKLKQIVFSTTECNLNNKAST